MRAGGWGVAGRSYYRWREEYGGLKMDQDRQMKELERGERPAVKRLVVDLSLDKAPPDGGGTGKLLSPTWGG